MKKIAKLRFVFRALFDLAEVLWNRKLTFKERINLVTAIGRLKFFLFAKKENSLIRFHFGNKKIEAYNNPALQFLVKEIFVEQIYRVNSTAAFDILDIGANIGLATLYFSAAFPMANITAFEPDKHSFDLLKKNVQQYLSGSIQIRNEAVGVEEGVLFGNNSSGFASINNRFTSKQSGEKIKAVSLAKLLEDKYDIVKMDIEGGEWDALKSIIANDRLKMADHWLIEFHPTDNSNDWLHEVKQSFKRNGFDMENRKDVVYFYKKDIRK